MDFQMRKLICILLSALVLTSCSLTENSRDFKLYSKLDVGLDEHRGIKAYRKNEFERAFKLLSEPAQLGYKGAQYALGFMFLKGQHVEQSSVIGMAWLAVATQADVKEWRAQYQQFYAAAPADLKLKIDQKAADYIAKYGVIAQDITCQDGINRNTTSVRVKCFKGTRPSVIHPIELVE